MAVLSPPINDGILALSLHRSVFIYLPHLPFFPSSIILCHDWGPWPCDRPFMLISVAPGFTPWTSLSWARFCCFAIDVFVVVVTPRRRYMDDWLLLIQKDDSTLLLKRALGLNSAAYPPVPARRTTSFLDSLGCGSACILTVASYVGRHSKKWLYNSNAGRVRISQIFTWPLLHSFWLLLHHFALLQCFPLLHLPFWRCHSVWSR